MSEPIPYPTSQAAYPVTKPAATPPVYEPLHVEVAVVEELLVEEPLYETPIVEEPTYATPVESEAEVEDDAFDHLLEGSGEQDTEHIESTPEEVTSQSEPVFFALKPVGAPVVEPIAEVSEEPVVEGVDEHIEEPVAEVFDEPVEEPVEVPDAEPSFEVHEHELSEESEPELFEEPQLETVEAHEDVEPISPFEISPTLVMEPQTNSIVIAEIPDPIRVADIVTDSGLILKTDSIEIVPVTTGQIEIIPESPESDVADSIDSAASFVPSVAPVRASGVMNSKALVGALPSRRRRVMDLTVTSVTLGIAILTVSVLALLGYMLGVLK